MEKQDQTKKLNLKAWNSLLFFLLLFNVFLQFDHSETLFNESFLNKVKVHSVSSDFCFSDSKIQNHFQQNQKIRLVFTNAFNSKELKTKASVSERFSQVRFIKKKENLNFLFSYSLKKILQFQTSGLAPPIFS